MIKSTYNTRNNQLSTQVKQKSKETSQPCYSRKNQVETKVWARLDTKRTH